jgi:hypothetical protein
MSTNVTVAGSSYPVPDTLHETGWTSLTTFLQALAAQTVGETAVTIDIDSSEALLVRRDGDSGDVFLVDTSAGPPGIVHCKVRSYVNVDSSEAFLVANAADTQDVFAVSTNGQQLILGGGPTISWGAGAPSADEPVGSTYHRTDGGAGTSFYVKETAGGGGWVGK